MWNSGPWGLHYVEFTSKLGGNIGGHP